LRERHDVDRVDIRPTQVSVRILFFLACLREQFLFSPLYNSFACQPLCGPARAAMQTGLFATQTGVFRNEIPLPDNIETMAKVFARNGYATGYIGKWHLAGNDPVPKHLRGGYQSWLAANHLEFVSDAYDAVLFDEDNNRRKLPGYRVDALTDAAIRYCDAHQDEPFFLFVSFLEPHRLMAQYSVGALPAVILQEATATERRKIVWSARAILAFYAGVTLVGVLFGQWFPLILTLGAKVSGGWLHAWMSYTQHTGMPENVNDHRLNTRTVCTHPLLQFLYWNMNFHIEHHMFPMVPFYALPELHRELKSQMPPAYRGFRAAWREIIPTLIEQTRNPNYFVERKLHPALLD
jgi:hypothetical protein